jgi:hypothetical protein
MRTRSRRNPARLARALAFALACAPAAAQQGEPIGSWWLIDMSGGGPSRHALMTLSTQGSAALAIQCAAGRLTVLLGLNRPELRPRIGPGAVQVEFQAGTGERRPAEAALTSDDTLELDERSSAEIVGEAARAPSFSIHLPKTGEAETALVFRPVETTQALERLQASCGKP